MLAANRDEVDFAILGLLQENGRRTAADVARRLQLSPTAVKRRIERLEEAEVITGYSARVDYAKLGWGITAFTELRYTGNTSPDDMNRIALGPPEVTAVYTTAGQQDVIAVIRSRTLTHLRDIINRLRASGSIVGTQTHVILDAQIKEDWRPDTESAFTSRRG